jgi:hypothetical protein
VKDDLEDAPRRGRGRPSKPIDYSQHSVKPGCFWFDVEAAVMSLWGNRPVLILWDEGDDFLSAASADVHWWLVQIHGELQRDFRRCNISTIVTSHGWNLLADICYKRATNLILLPGVRAGKNTMIKYTATISNLHKGQMIAEIKNREFGIARFAKIDGAIQGKIDGLKNSFKSLDESQRQRIRRGYEEFWNGTDIINLDNLTEHITTPDIIEV